MIPIRFLGPAEWEMLDAARYYELQATGLGRDFLEKIDSVLKSIAECPESCPAITFNVRRRLIHRFPYGLLYRLESQEIIILAVMHLHRRPDYWTDRLR